MSQARYYTAAETRELDRLTIEKYHIPGFELMQRAGLAAWRALQTKWPEARCVIVFCGTGNNGGDGFIIGTLAKKAGLQVKIYLLGATASIKNDALTAYEMALANKVPFFAAAEFLGNNDPLSDPRHTVIVDALLGTGLSGPVREPYSNLISRINQSNLPVLAVDIPSGLSSDTGEVLGKAIRARLTVTFIGIKKGLLANAGPEYCGELVFNNLDIPEAVYRELEG